MSRMEQRARLPSLSREDTEEPTDDLRKTNNTQLAPNTLSTQCKIIVKAVQVMVGKAQFKVATCNQFFRLPSTNQDENNKWSLEPFYASIFGGPKHLDPPKSTKNLFLVEKKWGGPKIILDPHFFSTRNKYLILFVGVQNFGTPQKCLHKMALRCSGEVRGA